MASHYEAPIRRPLVTGEIDEQDFMDRARLLCSLGQAFSIA